MVVLCLKVYILVAVQLHSASKLSICNGWCWNPVPHKLFVGDGGKNYYNLIFPDLVCYFSLWPSMKSVILFILKNCSTYVQLMQGP